jgi:biotin carboxyl carrier protein
MKYTVKIADQSYEVEIEDIHARPVVARVDGQQFEVHPETGVKPEAGKEANEIKPFSFAKQAPGPASNINEMTAPLPGTVIEVFVKAGEQIEAGQVIVIIEAMKMKNSIRSVRAGRIAEILVSAGQTISHKQALVRFE